MQVPRYVPAFGESAGPSISFNAAPCKIAIQSAVSIVQKYNGIVGQDGIRRNYLGMPTRTVKKNASLSDGFI